MLGNAFTNSATRHFELYEQRTLELLGADFDCTVGVSEELCAFNWSDCEEASGST